MFIFSSSTSSNFLHHHNFCSQLDDKLSQFYQYVYTLTVINYLAPPIILSFSGARACVELCWYKEARSWLYMGLAVSFNEYSKVIRDAMRVIFEGKSIRSVEILQHIMQAMFSYTALSSLKKLKYSLRVLSTIPRNLTQKKTNSQSFCWMPLIFVSRRTSPWRPNLNQ